MRLLEGVLRKLAWFAMATGVFGMAPDAVAQTTMGNSGTGGTLWTSKGCGSCHAQTAAPINAANAGGHILYAIANGMPALATLTEANDLAAYLGTFLTAPATVTVNQNSASNAIALPQLTLNTIRGQYTGIQVVTAPVRGSVTFSGTTASYTPFTGQTGADSFTYQATTAEVGCTGSCSSVRTQSINIVVPNPANNNFANRTTLSGTAAHLIATNAGPTTKEAGEPAHAGNVGGKSVWWTWTAPFTNTVTIQTSGSNFNTLLAVYTGSAVNALTPVISNDDCGASCSPANTSKVAFTATAGVTYQIAVDGFNAGSGAANGQITLDLFQIPLVPNDNFANATVIPAGITGVSGDNTFATLEVGEPTLANGRTLWWRWTAPTTAIYRIALAGSSVNAFARVYTGNTLAALIPVSFGFDIAYQMFPGSYYNTVTFYATAGTEYRIQIDDLAAQGGFVYFSFDKPGNDNFTAGLHVFGNEFHIVESNVGASTEGSEPLFFESNTVWFKWTAPSTAPVTIDTCGSAFRSIIGVYTLPPYTLMFPSAVGVLQPVPYGYAQPLCPDPKNFVSQFTAVAGTQYFIQVGTAVAFIVPPTADNDPGIYHLNIYQPPPITYTGTAVSRKVHGSVGIQDLPLNAQPINGSVVIEPRSIGAGHVIAFAFSGTVYALGTVTAEDAAGTPVGNVSATNAGNEVLVTLSGIAEGQRAKVTVSGVNGVASATVSLGFLTGDVTGTGAVNAADIAAVKARRGKSVSAADNFRFDIDASGNIDDADVTRVKVRSGNGLP